MYKCMMNVCYVQQKIFIIRPDNKRRVIEHRRNNLATYTKAGTFSRYFNHLPLGHHLCFHQDTAGDIPACGNPLFPLYHGAGCPHPYLSQTPAGNHPAAGADLCHRKPLRHLPVLPAGKYCPDVYHGLQCRGDYLHSAVPYRHSGLPFSYKRRRRQ